MEPITSAVVDYVELQDSYDHLVKQLDKKKTELEHNISKVKDLRLVILP